MSAKRCVAALAVAAALAAAAAAADEPKAPTAKVKKHLGDEAIAILDGATKVEAFRIEPRGGKTGDNQIGGHAITATGKEQGKEFAARLAKVLEDEKTLFGQQARCFDPGVAFRLWKGKESVEVIICFACTNLRLTAKDGEGKEIKKTFGAFGPELGPLLKLAKEAFPDDKEIQGLKEKGKE